MVRRPPVSNRTYTLVPYTTRFRAEQVGHLRDRRPPDDVRLDLVELAKGAVDSRWRPQRRIDLVGRHTVGQQGEFERIFGGLAHPALAGETFDVPEIDRKSVV